jgi:hypothetical protein
MLALHWLRGVPVLRNRTEGLNVFERFILEMARDFGSVSGHDVSEILGLEPEFLVWGAWRLAVAGALHREENGCYRFVPDVANTLLSTKELPRPVPSTADFLLLPRTGDLLAVASGDRWLLELDRRQKELRPPITAPAPAGLWGRRRAEYLAERVSAKEIAGSDRAIAEVVVPVGGDEPLLPSLLPNSGKATQTGHGLAGSPTGCDAYSCSADVSGDPDNPEIDVVLHVAPGTSGRAAKPLPRADLTGARHLIAAWTAQLDALNSPPNMGEAWTLVAGTAHPYQRVEQVGVSTWAFYVSGEAADAIAASGRSLAETAGLEIESGETILEAQIELRAADTTAESLFARDVLLASLHTASDPRAILAAAHWDEKALRERIWRLGDFRTIYRLREPEDFSYDEPGDVADE